MYGSATLSTKPVKLLGCVEAARNSSGNWQNPSAISIESAPQVSSEFFISQSTSAISVSDNTLTDIVSMNLPQGTYLISYGVRGNLTYASAPTGTATSATITNSSSTAILSGTGRAGLSILAGLGEMATAVSKTEILKGWSGGTIKLRALVSTTSGSSIDRFINDGYLRATRIG